MHELSIAIGIVDIASDHAKKNNARQVKEIEIEVGSLSGIVIDALDFAMDAAIKNSICDNAQWKIIEIPARSVCTTTKKEYPSNDLYSKCPFCGMYGHELISGRELRVKSLLVE